MRVGFAAIGLALLVGCGVATSDEGTTQSQNDTDTTAAPLATSLAIDEIAIFQGLKVTLEKGGAAVPASLPLLAGRDGLVRVYVAPIAGATPENVTATLEVADADGDVLATLTDTKTLAAASTEADLASTFNFSVAGAKLPLGATFRVALRTPKPSPVTSSRTNKARFPGDGTRAPVGITAAGQHLKVVFVPVHYAFGGASFDPDVTAEQIERGRKAFMTLYPLASVEISMHAPYTFSQEIKANGAGFGALLREMLTLRSNDGVAGDVYYWGAFQAAATFAEYCPQGCVTGLSGIYGPDATNGRASVGVGFTGESSARTMAHELGHAHGRPHAPCGGVAGPDPGFPYPDGSIGRWGFDARSQKLIDPAAGKDVMSYCRPAFISDYNYGKLFERLTHVNEAAAAAASGVTFAKLGYRFVEVAEDGGLTFGQHIGLTELPDGERHGVDLKDATGQTIAHDDAFFTPYDHVGGGYLLIPDLGDQVASVAVDGFGTAKR